MTDKTEAQSEALRLAQFFESLTESSHRWWDGVPVHEKAATVLRALVQGAGQPITYTPKEGGAV